MNNRKFPDNQEALKRRLEKSERQWDLYHSKSEDRKGKSTPEKRESGFPPEMQQTNKQRHKTMSEKKSSGFRWFTFLFAFLFISIQFLPVISENAADFLVIRDKKFHGDALVVLGGGHRERVEYAVRLYKENLAPKIIFTGDSIMYPGINEQWCDLARIYALELGVPEDAIILEPNSTSTIEDALYTRKTVKENNFKSLLVVSEPFHMRRAALSFTLIFEKDLIKIGYYGVENSWFNTKKWWTRESELVTVATEYIKLTFYFVNYKLLRHIPKLNSGTI